MQTSLDRCCCLKNPAVIQNLISKQKQNKKANYLALEISS